MKKLLFIALILSLTTSVFAQAPEVSMEANGTKILKGFFTQKDIATDSTFTWYSQNRIGFTPDQNAVMSLRKQKDSISIIAFGGTWCGDTKNLLPKFFALTDAAGLSPDRVTLIGVDRSKKDKNNLTEAFRVFNVPTFIVMKNGKEIGRVVEYGKYGMVDREIGEIISSH